MGKGLNPRCFDSDFVSLELKYVSVPKSWSTQKNQIEAY